MQVDGERAVVGAFGADGGNEGVGAAFVFERDKKKGKQGGWTQARPPLRHLWVL
jgi:hypothetical protein